MRTDLSSSIHAQINSFYLQKENELKVRLRTLIDKKKVLQSDTRRLKHASTLFKAIQEAFVQFEQELTKIQVTHLARFFLGAQQTEIFTPHTHTLIEIR